MPKEIPGQKIRRQYFNIPIYLLLSIWAAITSAVITDAIVNQTMASAKWVEDALFMFAIMAMMLLPLLLLSVVNRFCFGEVICVLNDKGLYYEDDTAIRYVAWNDIKQVLYEPDLPGKVGYLWNFCCNTVHITIKSPQKNVEIELGHAPFFLLGKMRRYNPKAKYGFTRFGWIMVFFYLFGPSVASVLVMLLG